MSEQRRSTDLNKPEMTGRRRYKSIDPERYISIGHVCRPEDRLLVLEVEESVYTEVSGVRGWEIRWRKAMPEDVQETVIGLPSNRG